MIAEDSLAECKDWMQRLDLCRNSTYANITFPRYTLSPSFMHGRKANPFGVSWPFRNVSYLLSHLGLYLLNVFYFVVGLSVSSGGGEGKPCSINSEHELLDIRPTISRAHIGHQDKFG